MASIRWLVAGWLVASCLGCAGLGQKVGGLRIYIETDLEGASGVYKFAQTREVADPLYEQAKEYLMGDIAAVVRGLRDAGATDIVVFDGHGSQAFVPHLMEPGAKYITGLPRPDDDWGMYGKVDGFVMLGFHAMKGTPDGVLNHTQSSRGENRYWYNGVESGEIAQSAALAGCHDVPSIMVTGDEAACREAHQFLGDACVTIAVKRGLSRESAILYPFAETRKALYEGAKRAVAAMPRCKPYRIATPIQAKKQFLQFAKPIKPGEDPGPGKLMTKEGVIEDVSKLLKF